MKQKKLVFIAGLLLLVPLYLLFWKQAHDDAKSKISPKSGQGSSQSGARQADQDEQRVGRSRIARNGKYHFSAIKLINPPNEADKIQSEKFYAGGSGTRGAIRDQEGNLVWRATLQNPVYSISMSPDDKKIVAGAGDGKAYVITNKGEKITDLPQFPPGKDMLGFGNWVWLDNNRLLGESGVQNFDENGQEIGCCQGHNMSETQFHVYDLRTKEMEEMQLPEDLRGRVVNVGKVLKTGELQLGHAGDEFDWYKVADDGEERR